MRSALAAALLAAVSGAPAIAQMPAAVVLSGRAVTGTDRRPATVSFVCTGNEGKTATGAISIVLEVPDAATLRPLFDFDPFEGPDATTAAKSHLSVGAGGTAHQADFAPSGSIPGTPDTAFDLTVAAAIRGDAAGLMALAGLFRSLGNGPATMEWRQANPRSRSVPLVATFEIPATDASRIATLLAPCLAAARR